MTSVFLTFFEYQICLLLAITSWLFAITAYQESLFHNDFPSFWPSNILVETCWHLEFIRFVVRLFSYQFCVLYIEFDLFLSNNRETSWKESGESVFLPQIKASCLSRQYVLAAATSTLETLEHPRRITFLVSNKNCLEISLVAGFGYGWITYMNIPSKFSILKLKICFLYNLD